MNNYPAGVSDDDPYFTDELGTQQKEPRCPSCGGVIAEHYYYDRILGQPDWLCLDEQAKRSAVLGKPLQ